MDKSVPPPYSNQPQPCYPPPGGVAQPGYPPPGGVAQPGYPPPVCAAQPGYPPSTQHTTVVVATTMPHMPFGEAPVQIACPYCKQSIVTAAEYINGNLVFLVACVIFVMGFWLGCCLIPFCVDGLKDVRHTCPCCNMVVGHCKRM